MLNFGFKFTTFMKQEQPNNPLHGITLKALLNHLVDSYGWEHLGTKVDIRCFNYEPSINSSLKFLRKTPWARKKVEDIYIELIRKQKLEG